MQRRNKKREKALFWKNRPSGGEVRPSGLGDAEEANVLEFPPGREWSPPERTRRVQKLGFRVFMIFLGL